MKLKSELYKNRQNEICDEIISILDLDDKHSITLYHLDNDIYKQKALIDLTPKIRKFFRFAYIAGVRDPEKIRRPYLSIIKSIVKLKYLIVCKSFHMTINKNKIRTTKYFFIKKILFN